MNKRDFIQRCVSNAINQTGKEQDEDVITRAERYWERLSQRGYGASKQHVPRDKNKNGYNQLTPYQKQWFDQFWNAFSYKHGRSGAAIRWHQMGELPQGDYEHIVDAAKAEAASRPEKVAQKITPIMAQGWLNNSRYEDHQRKQDTNAKQTESKRQEKIIDLKRDLAFYTTQDSNFARDEVKKIRVRLKKMEVK